MPGYSIFAILVVFMCARPWANCVGITQKCVLIRNGVQDGPGPDDQGIIPLDEGSDLRIYIPGVDNVIGSSLLFCDEQVDALEIEMAEDKQSYLITRLTNSSEHSLYWIKLFVEPEPMKIAYRQLPQVFRRLRRH